MDPPVNKVFCSICNNDFAMGDNVVAVSRVNDPKTMTLEDGGNTGYVHVECLSIRY